MTHVSERERATICVALDCWSEELRDGAEWIEDSSYFQKCTPLSSTEVDELRSRLDPRRSVTSSQNEPKREAEQFELEIPTFIGALKAQTKDDSPDDFSKPTIPVLLTVGSAIRAVLGTHDAEDENKPDIYIERRPNGWAIFLHPDGGDACAYIYILDDGQSFCVRDELVPSPLRVVDECPPEVDHWPHPR